MKIRNLILKLALAVSLAGLTFTNVNAVDATGTATVVVLTPLTISQTTEMNFGQVAGSTAAGNVVLSGNVTTPDVNTSVFAGNGELDAVFTISGSSSANIIITPALGTLSATLDDVGAGAAMTVDTFTSTTGYPAGLDGAGSASFDLGATLHLNANQASGTYTTGLGTGATYTITVNYN